MGKPRLISIILYDGDPDGLREADIKISTIKAVAFPRNQLARAIQEVPELNSPGAYVLFGQNPNKDDRMTAYIGESEHVSKRLAQHLHSGNTPAKQEQYEHWVDTIALVSKDKSLTKSHALFLESRLADIAAKNPSWVVRSGKTPGKDAGALTKPEKIAAEEFLEQAILLMGTLGLDLFQIASAKAVFNAQIAPQQATASANPNNGDLTNLEFAYEGAGWKARMIVSTSGRFTVKKGSQFRKNEAPTLSAGLRKIRSDLLDNGLLANEQGGFFLNEDYEFASVTAAAAAVSGSTVNGRISWRTADGKTYAQLEEAGVPVQTENELVDE